MGREAYTEFSPSPMGGTWADPATDGHVEGGTQVPFLGRL